ncbi:MAG TPA: pentapeptide repeat-containing protein [Ignavibacteria bacterium]|nr:pentapeptide repeat-containing protein [Ignavibacteria bacterium]
MENKYTSEKLFKEVDFSIYGFTAGEYEQCTFVKCNFSNCSLADSRFIECEFDGCDLSMAKLNNASLRDVSFNESKMLALRFENCNQFGLSMGFKNCILNDSSFYKTSLKKTIFNSCSMHDTDLTNCDLSGAELIDCDLKGAVFSSTNLEKADLRTSMNYIIDPEINKIKKAKFSIPGVFGLLNKYDIKIDLS